MCHERTHSRLFVGLATILRHLTWTTIALEQKLISQNSHQRGTAQQAPAALERRWAVQQVLDGASSCITESILMLPVGEIP